MQNINSIKSYLFGMYCSISTSQMLLLLYLSILIISKIYKCYIYILYKFKVPFDTLVTLKVVML